MAHVIASAQYFLFPELKIFTPKIWWKINYPDSDTFDIDVNVTLVRSHSRKIQVKTDYYKRFVDHATSFDYLEYGADDTYDISFRVVRIKISVIPMSVWSQIFHVKNSICSN